ncbi:MAG: hypothetical protein AAGK23_02760 [Pseudomonadota bacterium]
MAAALGTDGCFDGAYVGVLEKTDGCIGTGVFVSLFQKYNTLNEPAEAITSISILDAAAILLLSCV